MNDVVSYVEKTNVLLYADDTAFYLSDQNKTTLNEPMLTSATRFYLWCNLNRLTLNLSKSKLMTFNLGKLLMPVNEYCIKINSTNIDHTSEYIYIKESF